MRAFFTVFVVATAALAFVDITPADLVAPAIVEAAVEPAPVPAEPAADPAPEPAPVEVSKVEKTEAHAYYYRLGDEVQHASGRGFHRLEWVWHEHPVETSAVYTQNDTFFSDCANGNCNVGFGGRGLLGRRR